MQQLANQFDAFAQNKGESNRSRDTHIHTAVQLKMPLLVDCVDCWIVRLLNTMNKFGTPHSPTGSVYATRCVALYDSVQQW